MARVVMFVLNDVRHDARVRREAATLAAAGHEVTVIGRPTDLAATIGDREAGDGFEIRRVAIPGRLRRLALRAGGGRGRAVADPGPDLGARDGVGRDGTGPRSVRGLLAIARLPVVSGLVRGIDLLLRWRLGTVAWGRAAAAAAPVADVWHAHDLTGFPAALEARRRHGGRLVFDAHELYLEAGDTATRPGWARAVLGRTERQAIEAADAVVTVNAGLAAELSRRGRPRRLVVVHNTPPRPTARPPRGAASPLRAAAGIPPGAPIALYHGSLAAGRGVDVVVAALRQPGLEAVHAVFLGAGAGHAALAAAATDPALRGRVHILDPVSPDEVVRWVAGADVGVMPIAPSTLNHRLSTPNKLFECLAAGVPVVASDFPGIREVVLADPAAPLGTLVDPTDPAAVARAIREVVELGPAARRAYRARCLAAARDRWNWEHESAALIALYAELAPAAAGVGAATPGSQRVTFVLPTSGEFDSRTRRMATSLAGRGHDVLVIARAEAGLPGEEVIAPGATLRRVAAGPPPAPTPATSRGLAWIARESVRIARTALRARTQTRAARAADRPADLYHAMGFLALPVAIDLARRARSPFVYDARDLYAEGNNVARMPGPARALFARRERSWARRAAAVLTVNGALADELAGRLGIDRPAVVMNGQAEWQPPDPPPDRLRDELVLPPTAPVVLYHGGFMRDRGLPELIAALRAPGLERAHLVLLGGGPLAAELDRLASAPDLGDRVHLLPPVPPEDLLEWVASADVGVMPNQPRTINERLSTPNKLFECLAAGTPVVSSDFPERRRIIVDDPDGPLGEVCDPTDPAAIGAAIRSILERSPDERDELRARCRRAALRRYGWSTQLTALLALYGRVTGKPW